nr:hypothetical protein Iba_chr11aCG17950 [Ipomoea batatas]GMD59248.1 hypothetical protein Iba_chr11fCG13320 [Ipomoea batatas]
MENLFKAHEGCLGYLSLDIKAQEAGGVGCCMFDKGSETEGDEETSITGLDARNAVSVSPLVGDDDMNGGEEESEANFGVDEDWGRKRDPENR